MEQPQIQPLGPTARAAFLVFPRANGTAELFHPHHQPPDTAGFPHGAQETLGEMLFLQPSCTASLEQGRFEVLLEF